jgi:hypothetical protein
MSKLIAENFKLAFIIRYDKWQKKIGLKLNIKLNFIVTKLIKLNI